jgi:hypothetical protein
MKHEVGSAERGTIRKQEIENMRKWSKEKVKETRQLNKKTRR